MKRWSVRICVVFCTAMASLAPWLRLAIRIFIGGYFIFAAVPKIVEPYVFATNISHYGMLPAWSVNMMALLLPWLELVAGTALIIGFRLRAAAVLSTVMLAMFTIAVAWAVSKGLKIDCGCFGEGTSETVSWEKVAKNMAMIVLTLSLVIGPLRDNKDVDV